MMKKSMKTLGTIALAGISIAALAKLMHWPGASILILISTFIVSTIFFPAALYVWYKEVFEKKHGFIVILSFFAGFTFMYGALFKLMHWPVAGLLLGIGETLTILTIIIGGIVFLLSKQSNKYPKGVTITGIIGITSFFLGTLFKIQHWPGAALALLIGSILLFCVFIPIYAYHLYKNEQTIKNSFIFSVFAFIYIITFTFLLVMKFSQSILTPNLYRINEIHNSILVTEGQLKSFEDSNDINQTSNNLFNSITEFKTDLSISAEAYDINPMLWKRNNLEDLKYSNLDKASHELLEDPILNKKIHSLYNEVQDYKSFLIAMVGENSYSIDFIQETLSFEQSNADEWIKANFYKIPFINALNYLASLQLDVRVCQQEALSVINKTIAKSNVENIQE